MTAFTPDGIGNLLSTSKNVVITTHVSPDGDAIGSSLALYLFLKKTGHHPVVITPDDYPSFLHWLPENDVVLRFDKAKESALKYIDKAEVIFCLDFNTPDRMAGLRTFIEDKKCIKILIDHHQNPLQWTDYMLSDPNASSTSELVYRFIDDLGRTAFLDHQMATCLYTGIVTDTGSFKFPSTSAYTHQITAELMSLGIDTAAIQNKIYDNYSEKRIRLLGFSLTEKLKVISKYHTAIIGLTAEELKAYDFQPGDTEGIVNYPLSIAGVRMSVFISEKNNEVRMSFRSKGKVPVHEISGKYFKGGGHVNAAGGISDKSVAETIKKVEEILPEFTDYLC